MNEGKDNPIVVPSIGNVEPLPHLFFIDPKNVEFLTGKTKHVNRSAYSSLIILVWAFVLVLFSFNSMQRLLATVILLILTLAIIFTYQYAKRLKTLSEKGKVIQGKIVKVNQERKWHRSTSHWWKMTLYYEFKTPDDKVLGKSIVTHTEFPEQLPTEGTPILALYQDDKNYTIL